jgi:dTDP-4-amino-4,6-dideoxygalactose transaminase
MAALKRKPLPTPHPEPATVPIARPRLPTRAAIAPYLDRIDEARWYTNHGPLITELEARLAARLTGGAGVISCANGTAAITLALRAAGAKPGALCLTPAWTFCATAHAIVDAGLTPYFVDVDPETWMLDPAAACAVLPGAPAEVGAVVPVAAFGRVPDLARWRDFADGTGLPVVVDGAAAFDGLASAPVPVTVSLHATKTCAAGEGGYVASDNADFLERVKGLAAFGFHGERIARHAGTNAKLSEYAAAVALASLDGWPADRARFALTAQHLRAGLALQPEIAFQPGWGTRWVSSVCVVGAPDWSAPALAAGLAARGVATRDWWGEGCHRQPAFAHCPRGPLPVTERLACSTLGLPYFIDLEADAVARVAGAVADVLRETRHG